MGEGEANDGRRKASNTGSGDLFGAAVALSADGSNLAVGAPDEGSGAAGVNGAQGDNGAAQAGALLRRLRSPRRFYIPEEDDDVAVLLTMERAVCLVDAGIARFGYAAPAPSSFEPE